MFKYKAIIIVGNLIVGVRQCFAAQVENFAYTVFQRADDEDRGGNATKARAVARAVAACDCL